MKLTKRPAGPKRHATMKTKHKHDNRYNEQYAIDATHADLYLSPSSKESQLPMRPWLHMIVDQHSNMIVGFEVSSTPLNKRKLMAMVKATWTSQL